MDNLLEFDTEKYYLGTLCKYRHEWRGTGSSLRIKANRTCTVCRTISSVKWRKKNPEWLSEYRRIRSPIDRERCRQRFQNDESYREAVRLSRQQYFLLRKDEINSKRRLRRRHSAKIYQAHSRQYYWSHRERYLAANHRYYEQNRPKYYARNRLRKARKNQVHSLPYTDTQIQSRFKEFDNRCAYCLLRTSLTIDHFIPVSKGGTDTIGNIVPACTRCNCSKNDSDPCEWYQKQEYYLKAQWLKILSVLGKKESSYSQLPLF